MKLAKIAGEFLKAITLLNKKKPKSASMPIALKLMKENKSQSQLRGIIILERKVLDNKRIFNVINR